MGATRVKIREQNVSWAFNETDIRETKKEDIKNNYNWLQANDKNYLNPTIRQLDDFAKKLHIPFGNLLLPEIPKQEDIRMSFRTKENAPAQVSLNVRAIIHEMQRKQAWFKEESGYASSRLDLVGIMSPKTCTVDDVSAKVNELLTLKHFTDVRELFNDLRNQIAYLNILVMQKGGVGLGTNRPLNVEELRAFVLLDDYAPLIFLNQKDSLTARVFSLIHEFVHILRGTDELLTNVDDSIREERFINDVVAQFLMPEHEFKDLFKKRGLNKAALYFNVSPFAAAVRAKNLGLMNDIREFSVFDMETQVVKKSGGGNPYNTALSLNDNRFVNAIVDSQVRGTLPPTKAASLFGISTKMLDRTINTFNEREAKL